MVFVTGRVKKIGHTYRVNKHLQRVRRDFSILFRLRRSSARMTVLKEQIQNVACAKLAREKSQTGPIFGHRHIQIFLLLCLLVITYLMRVALSVAIVAMTGPNVSSNPNIHTYNWTNANVILSSLGWGYIALQFFAGDICKKYGVRWILVGSMILNSLFVVLLPPAADWFGSEGVIACRVLQGLFQGFFYPAVNDMLSKWLPCQERARMGTLVYVGPSLGTTIGMVSTGYICAGDWGWPGAFYLFGVIGFAWVGFWIAFGISDPSKCKRISQEELKYIELNLGCMKTNRKDLKTPYKKIFTSLPVWAIMIAGIGNLWGCAILFNDMPLYMQHILNFNIRDNSVLSAAPYLAVLVFNAIFSTIADLLINKQILSITVVRKLFTTIGMIFPAIALIILALVPGQKMLSVSMLILTIGINAASNSGIIINMIDLSPNHSGVIMGICNGATTLASIFAPLMAQAIVTDYKNQAQWKLVFLISSALFILPNIFYIIFASGKVQPWNDNNKITEEDEEEVNYKRRSTPRITVIDVEVPLD